MESNQVMDILLQINSQMEGLHSKVDRMESRISNIESKIDSIETRMDSLESKVSNIETRVDSIEARVDGIETKIGCMESDIAGIKATVHRIEQQQQEAVLTILRVIDTKVTEINNRQDETDHVIDVLSARTTRLQAKKEYLSGLDN